MKASSPDWAGVRWAWIVVVLKLWLASIRQLTAEQRSDAFRALALAEADLPQPATVMEDATVDVAVSAVVSWAVAAQAHAERAGCPHCASRKLQRWGHASGLPRYRCGDCR